MKYLVLLILLTIIQTFVLADDPYCFGKDTNRTQVLHFTSKTAYQKIKNVDIDKKTILPNCAPKKVWIFHRHGTRLPSKSTIEKASRLETLRDEIVNNYQVRRARAANNTLCTEDYIALKLWKWNSSITPDQENFLTYQGYEDLKGTAKLYQKLLPEVLTNVYDKEHYLFRFTNTQRTNESFKAFTVGLFGDNNNVNAEPIPEKDLLLRPYDYCEPWNQQDYKSPNSENYKYKHSLLWNKTIAEISARLGYNTTLAGSDVELMYDICRYEQAWQVDRTSVWCAAFTPEHVGVFEYEDDMKYFYKSGYGYEDNARLNCRAVKDMLTRLSNDESPHATAYFGHSTGLQTLITALGIKKDNVKLLATNYNELNNRQWRTSLIDPFAANFLAIKYECPNSNEDKQKIAFFLNQYSVDLSWCTDGLCNLSDVLKRYETFTKADCDQYYCRSSATILQGIPLISLLMIVLKYFINYF